ncbi:hypothetical protein [Desulfomonile tiedjei]|uniref:Uncharacterized protein n=1 Tax=Desulfomonile tiedjei (strain ATCC 49306 / DSM 6799 / DCB-1) TaxID=706587 RepID=I4C3I2_DESTA|nr:hypothetical protein [Desulfomonile tiedjei]AFM24123.1 hypothetical protein Desti_1411 [Desulfomonile tiedjei DSM 6799]
MRIDLEITPRLFLPAVLWLAWAVSVVALLSLAIGGYHEHEPRAGMVFIFMAVAVFVLGPAVKLIGKKKTSSSQA